MQPCPLHPAAAAGTEHAAAQAVDVVAAGPHDGEPLARRGPESSGLLEQLVRHESVVRLLGRPDPVATGTPGYPPESARGAEGSLTLNSPLTATSRNPNPITAWAGSCPPRPCVQHVPTPTKEGTNSRPHQHGSDPSPHPVRGRSGQAPARRAGPRRSARPTHRRTSGGPGTSPALA